MKRWPLGPTVMTMAMLAVLLGMGVWQLNRKAWKEELLRQVALNRDAPVLVLESLGSVLPDQEFRKARLNCSLDGRAIHAVKEFGPGRALGVRMYVPCRTRSGIIIVRLKWSPEVTSPAPVAGPQTFEGQLRFWKAPTFAERLGGVMTVGPGLFAGPVARFYLDQQGEIPDQPNNHLGYAIQWFAFGATLLAVYAVYLARWRRQMLNQPR